MSPDCIQNCFRTLELPPSATPAEVQAAFRRLARSHHPDINPTPNGQARFLEVVAAYHTLREMFRYVDQDVEWGPCPRCGRAGVLLAALSGGLACADCLLGGRRARYFLPMPPIVLVKHLTVCALYVVAVVLAWRFGQTGQLGLAGWSAACALGGLLLLAAEVLWVTRPPAGMPAARPDLTSRAQAGRSGGGRHRGSAPGSGR